MLIKNKKLGNISSSHRATNLEVNESIVLTRQEVNKAKQEARAIKHEAENILQEAQKKLSEAEAMASDIIREANLQSKEIKEKTYKETLKVAQEEAERIKSKSKELLKELFEVKRQALIQAHNEIIKIALDLASKIIKYQASVDPEVLKTQVLESIKKATTESDRVQVFVNPADIKLLEQSIPELGKLFPSGIDIVPLTNESVDQGSCLVETRSGQLDARFSTQLQSLIKLVEHLEVKEPQIEIKEDFEPSAPPQSTEEIATGEKQILEEELLGNKSLIDFLGEEEETEIIKEDSSERKKLFVEDLLNRTQEESDELDEEYEYEEVDVDAEENIEPPSILKPKKAQPEKQISNIAEEIEKNPEWKNLLQDEDEQ